MGIHQVGAGHRKQTDMTKLIRVFRNFENAPKNPEHVFSFIHYGPGVDSASNRNEYQEYFLGGKSGRCVRLTNLLPSCAVVMKSGNLNFLEPSGPLQACNRTALPL